ncbi:MAG: hypothetical protein PHZ03_01885 [Syntrophomonas sp.]|nr:hypothetical protein [Syntrophomonas sp.]
MKIRKSNRIMEQRVIKPYHVFNHKGSWYVINVEGMSASTIDETTAWVLASITADPAASLDSHMEEQFKKLGLMSAGEELANLLRICAG